MVTHPPRFNGIVKAVESKIKVETVPKIGNLDTNLRVAKGRLIKTGYCGYHGYCGYCSDASY